MPVLKGNQRDEPEFFIAGLEKFRMFRKGDFKIVKLNGGEWELYNLKNDPSEIENLAGSSSEKVKELSDTYRKVTNDYLRVK